MSYASISGRAKTNPRNPKAFGYCDRDGMVYNLEELVWEKEWRGNNLLKTGFRVCRRCLDKPFEHYRPLYLPPDPEPVDQPRAGNMAIQESGPEGWDEPGAYWDDGQSWDPTGNANT